MKQGSMPSPFHIILPKDVSETSELDRDRLHPICNGFSFATANSRAFGRGLVLSQTFSGRDYSIEMLQFNGFTRDVFRVRAGKPLVLFIYVVDGTMDLILKGNVSRQWRASTYAAFYVPKGTHKIRVTECRITCIVPSFEQLGEYNYLTDLLAHLLSGSRDAAFLPECNITDSVNRILYRLLHCRKTGGKLSLAVQSYMLDLLHTYGMQLKTKGADNLRIKRVSVKSVADYILLNLTGETVLNTTSLAERFFTTRKILDKDFKEVYNESVYQFITRQRMEFSRATLLKTRSVQKAAYEMGYEDVFTFSKAFKRWWGFAPSAVWK